MAGRNTDPTTRVDSAWFLRLACYDALMYHEHEIECPYCGETITSFIDLSQGNMRTIEDCWVCCRPIELLIESDGEQLIRLVAKSEDEQVY